VTFSETLLPLLLPQERQLRKLINRPTEEFLEVVLQEEGQ